MYVRSPFLSQRRYRYLRWRPCLPGLATPELQSLLRPEDCCDPCLLALRTTKRRDVPPFIINAYVNIDSRLSYYSRDRLDLRVCKDRPLSASLFGTVFWIPNLCSRSKEAFHRCRFLSNVSTSCVPVLSVLACH